MVSFNGVAAQVTSWAANQIVVAVPAGATTGPITVKVAGCSTAACTATSPTAFTVSGSGGGGITEYILLNGRIIAIERH